MPGYHQTVSHQSYGLKQKPTMSSILLLACILQSTNAKLHGSMSHVPDQFWPGQGQFIDEAWAIVVITISIVGWCISLGCIVYVICKVCNKAIGSRNVGLGLLLLMSVLSLFMSVVPYVVTPSQVVCGLRVLLPGLSYTVCFGVILVKLMSISEYKQIGLGGDVCRTNLYVTLLLTVGVQVGIATLWWIYRGNGYVSQHFNITVESTTELVRLHQDNDLFHACLLDRQSYALYHIYVILLLFLCLAYGWTNRHEKRNSHEGLILLIACAVCFVIWIVWLLLFFLLDRKHSDIIVCASVLGCAFATLFIVFTPKIRMVSRLSYSVSPKLGRTKSKSQDPRLDDVPYVIGGIHSIDNYDYSADDDDDDLLDIVPEMFQRSAKSGSLDISAVSRPTTGILKRPSHIPPYNVELIHY